MNHYTKRPPELYVTDYKDGSTTVFISVEDVTEADVHGLQVGQIEPRVLQKGYMNFYRTIQTKEKSEKLNDTINEIKKVAILYSIFGNEYQKHLDSDFSKAVSQLPNPYKIVHKVKKHD